jgi:hypothetical protein
MGVLDRTSMYRPEVNALAVTSGGKARAALGRSRNSLIFLAFSKISAGAIYQVCDIFVHS